MNTPKQRPSEWVVDPQWSQQVFVMLEEHAAQSVELRMQRSDIPMKSDEKKHD